MGGHKKIGLTPHPHGRAGLVGVENDTPDRKALDGASSPEDVAARQRPVEHHLPLVHRLCERFRGCGEPLEDLIQIGTIGLIKAIEKFDPSMGFTFITYAVPAIVGEIKNYLRDHGWAVRIPRKLQGHKLAVQRAVEGLTHELGRGPTIQEIAGATFLTEEEVFDAINLVNFGKPLSLDAENKAGGNGDVSRLIGYLGAEDPQFNASGDRIDLKNTMSRLSKREKTIIYLKFYAGLSQSEIGRRLGVSQMHVSRLQRSALDKLKQGLLGHSAPADTSQAPPARSGSKRS